MQAPDSQIAVTLYNLREYCQTESDLDCTLAKVRAMGYRAIQVSACPLPAEVIRKIMDRNDLYCCATHEGLDTIAGDTKALADKLQTLNCNFAALGYPGVEYTKPTPELVDKMAGILNRQGDALAAYGIMLGYHNHHIEFARVAGTKQIFLKALLDATAGHNVWSELDVHWVTRGGGSPAAWISALAGRINVIHFKDFTVLDGEPRYCEIGEGNLDWPEILRVCEATGVRWYSIEQDEPFPGRGIFDSIKMSYDNLRAMGVK